MYQPSDQLRPASLTSKNLTYNNHLQFIILLIIPFLFFSLANCSTDFDTFVYTYCERNRNPSDSLAQQWQSDWQSGGGPLRGALRGCTRTPLTVGGGGCQVLWRINNIDSSVSVFTASLTCCFCSSWLSHSNMLAALLLLLLLSNITLSSLAAAFTFWPSQRPQQHRLKHRHLSNGASGANAFKLFNLGEVELRFCCPTFSLFL